MSMKKQLLAASLAVSTFLSGPAFAFTVTKVNSTLNWAHNASAVHSVSLTTNVAIPANDYLVVGLGARTAAAGDQLVVSDSVDGTIPSGQVIPCQIGSTAAYSAVAYIKTAGLPSGSTITIADTTNAGTLFTAGQLTAFGVNGIDGTNPLDSAANACNSNASNVTTQSVPSGTPGYSASLLFSNVWISQSIGTFTEDAAWAAQTGGTDTLGAVVNATFTENRNPSAWLGARLGKFFVAHSSNSAIISRRACS